MQKVVKSWIPTVSVVAKVIEIQKAQYEIPALCLTSQFTCFILLSVKRIISGLFEGPDEIMQVKSSVT